MTCMTRRYFAGGLRARMQEGAWSSSCSQLGPCGPTFFRGPSQHASTGEAAIATGKYTVSPMSTCSGARATHAWRILAVRENVLHEAAQR
jgi:hypothetical protein